MAEMVNRSDESGRVKRERSGGGAVPIGRLTPLQLHDLGLLERVIAARNSYENEPSKDPGLLHAINWAVYAAYLDCIDEGVGRNAKTLLHRELQISQANSKE